MHTYFFILLGFFVHDSTFCRPLLILCYNYFILWFCINNSALCFNMVLRSVFVFYFMFCLICACRSHLNSIIMIIRIIAGVRDMKTTQKQPKCLSSRLINCFFTHFIVHQSNTVTYFTYYLI